MSDNRGGISWFVRLLLDKRSADKVREDAREALEGGTDSVKPTQNLSAIERGLEKVRGVAVKIGIALAAAFSVNRIQAFIRESVTLAARYETLAVVLRRVGENAGYSADETDRAAKSLQDAGISMIESRQSAARLISANIDLAHATDLARIAQDAAVIANTNSSEAFNRLIHGIASGQTEILRTMGLNINFQRSYEKLGEQLGKNAVELTEVEKAQARTNAVIEFGARISGTYTDAMETAGKMAGSNERHFENLALKVGQVFLPAYTQLVDDWTDSLKGANEAVDDFADRGSAARIAGFFRGLTGTVTGFGRIVHNVFQSAADILHGVFATVNLLIVGSVNEGLRGINRLIEQANKIPGVNIGSVGTLDATVAALEAERTAATENYRKNLADINAAIAGIADSWRDVETATREAGAALGDDTSVGGSAGVGSEAYSARVEAMNKRLDEWLRSQDHYDVMTRLRTRPGAGETPDLNPVTANTGPNALHQLIDMFPRIEAAAQHAAYEMASAFEDAFNLMRREAFTIGNLFEGLGRGIAGAMLQGVAEYARGKVAENIAAAIEMGAKALGFLSLGNVPSTGAAWASAAQHAAAATAWAAAAGGAGAGRSAVTGGRGAVPVATRDAGLSTVERGERESRPIVINIDPFNPANPVHAKQVGGGVALDVRLNGRPEWIR